MAKGGSVEQRSSCVLQKSSAPTAAAEYKKTDEPQPDVKDEAEAEEEEEEAKEDEPGLMDEHVGFGPYELELFD